MTAPTLTRPVVALGAFGACEHGHGVRWALHLETDREDAIRALVAAQETAGRVTRHRPDTAAGPCALNHAGWNVLDLLAADGEPLEDRCIPPEHWSWWADAFAARAVYADCDTCHPHAYAVARNPSLPGHIEPPWAV